MGTLWRCHFVPEIFFSNITGLCHRAGEGEGEMGGGFRFSLCYDLDAPSRALQQRGTHGPL